MKGKELLTLAVALVLALALTGCAPKDAGVAILTGLDKKELALSLIHISEPRATCPAAATTRGRP